MVSDYKENTLKSIKQMEDDPKSIINSLCEDKLKLLNETKSLYNLLAEKDQQIIKLCENYQKKWENVCHYLRSVEELFQKLNINGSKLAGLKDDYRLLFSPQMDSSFSNSSFFTVTETADSNFNTSSESIVADTNDSLDGDKSDDGISERPKSQCLKCTDDHYNPLISSVGCIDSAISEPQFRIPEVPSPSSKRPIKRSSTVKTVKPSMKDEKTGNSFKSFSDYKEKDIIEWLIHVVRLPKVFVDDIRVKNKLEGISLDQMTDQKFCKMIGTNDKLIRKKVMLALEEGKSRENIPSNDLSHKDHVWVANVWLKKHLGLGHLSSAFSSRGIDGRLLKYIATCPHARQKELINLSTSNCDNLSGLSILPLNFISKNISEPSKSDMRSIKFALELLVKFDFNLDELEKRRAACENSNLDVLVWTNERVAKWFSKMNMKNYTRGIEYSGIHGGIMVLDPQFSMATMSKLLQIPTEVVKKNNLDDKFSALLKPSRFNEGVKNRRSASIFRRRSYSQPRYVKPVTNRNGKTSTLNTDASDSASTNDNLENATLKSSHKEKSQTIDLSSSTNQNFVRKYRKPVNDAPQRHKFDQVNFQPKLSAPKAATLSAQVVRKTKTKSASESENSEEL